MWNRLERRGSPEVAHADGMTEPDWPGCFGSTADGGRVPYSRA